jgi:hypothetical protein
VKARGYRRTRRVWRKSNDVGDLVVFDVQSSAFNSADEVRFFVNLAAIPAPAWDCKQDLGGRRAAGPGTPDGVYQERLRPSPGIDGGWWTVTSAETAQSAIQDLAQRLDEVALPLLDSLLDRAEMTTRLRERRVGFPAGFEMYADRWLAVLLSDDGPSDELDRVLARLASTDRDPRYAEWSRRRAATTAEH